MGTQTEDTEVGAERNILVVVIIVWATSGIP